MVTINSANNKTGASGTILQGQGVGTASDFSTATYPATASGTGTILRADGTNWVATTCTYPNTIAKGDIHYGSATNVVSDLAISTYSGVPLGVSDTGLPAYMSPRNFIFLYEEFFSQSTSFSMNWSTSTANSGSVTAQNTTFITSANIGIVTCGTATTTNAQVVIRQAVGSGTGPIILGGGYISSVWYAKLSAISDGTNTYTATIGLSTAQLAQNYTDGCWFQYTSTVNSGNWQIITMAASVATTNNTSTAADGNWHRFRIDINAAATSVAFYIDDVQVANSPNSTNIPTVQIGPAMGIVKSAGTTSRSFSADYYTYFQDLTSAR